MSTNNQPQGVVDEVTLLYCPAGHSASKKFIAEADGSVRKVGFDAGMYFGVKTYSVADIRTLSHLLRVLEPIPNVFVIRGDPKPLLDLDYPARRLKDNFSLPTLGRRWVLIDFDKIPLPEGLGVTKDPVPAAEYLVSLLPVEFHAASYHYQLSSSAGLSDPNLASMHLWFWLTTPWHDEDLKRWAKAVNAQAGRRLVDHMLFNPVQPHYVAAPVFVGMEDPLPVRSGLVLRERDEVDLQPIEPAQIPRTPAHSDGGEKSPGFEALLGLIGDHAGGEGFHEPSIRAIASHVGRHGRDGTDVEWLYETVRDRILEADRSQHEESYVEHMASREHIIPAIDGALEKYGDPDPRRKAKLVPGLTAQQDSKSEDDPETARARLDEALSSIVKVAK